MIRSAPTFIAVCPSCAARYPVDPDKVPEGGIPAICSACLRVFNVVVPEERVVPTAGAESDPDPDPPRSPTEPELHAETSGSATEPELEARTSGRTGAPPVEERETAQLEAPTGDAPPVLPAEADPSPHIAPPDGSQIPSPQADPASAAPRGDRADGVEGKTLSTAAQRFGRRDPHQRARHLARVLVSDIIAYHPERYRESLAQRTLKDDFQDEIRKSWKEYVDQVGAEMAEGTRYFDEALTEILGRGQPPS